METGTRNVTTGTLNMTNGTCITKQYIEINVNGLVIRVHQDIFILELFASLHFVMKNLNSEIKGLYIY